MKNRWNYSGLGQVQYGIEESYRRACQWLDEAGGTMEDWGCGCAFAKRYVNRCLYRGIDGSQNDFADVCGVDLAEFHSQADCILLRHVLDHNENWRAILDNAIASFRKRMALVFFRDFGPETRVISRSQDPKYSGVPDLQFLKADVLQIISPYLVKEDRLDRGELVDTIFYLEKK